MNEILKKLYLDGMVPAVKVENAETAVPAAKALYAGGIRNIEITFRTAAAEKAIYEIADKCPEMTVGAGTVLTAEQANAAKNAGARFIVAPGYNPKTVGWCLENGITVIPGCSCCSDIEFALEAGLEAVKLFPAEQLGGLAYIKALSGPYSKMRYLPTGGVNLDNVGDYAGNPKVLAAGGSFIAPQDALANGDYARITALAEETVKRIHGFKFRHLGINCADGDEAALTAARLNTLLGLENDDRGGAIFTAGIFEIIKKKGRGEKGHIAVSCNNCDRAAEYIKRHGGGLIEESCEYGPDGRLKVAYLDEEFAGFALHIINA
ncbi:MAG: bifunctional 4-hydroxy-2-oxoglutarate aldolase/2-dehydro-3-deoxy-phosphogluconate aldolase [Clostridia bacterium]|nr:bifunctional 4-hydroxy-2-oxoglutarate aldolase/2-dehydro-3-deoxy-phosphogluconate aldolase [Clostridia bacterium]